ncbi:MAG: hypothetical protein QM811_25920 [Pirellulales bacterium]
MPHAAGNTPGTSNYVALSATKQALFAVEGDYKPMGGTQKFVLPPDGMIIPDKLGKGQSMARMSDGTSKTAVLCESRETTRSNWYDAQQTFVCGFLPGDAVKVKEDEPAVYPFFDATGDFITDPKGEKRTALEYGPTPHDPKQAYNADQKDPLRREWGPRRGTPRQDRDPRDGRRQRARVNGRRRTRGVLQRHHLPRRRERDAAVVRELRRKLSSA